MKAVVLCAGAGVRLRPLTHVRPKHLLPVGGRAVLDWVLCDLADAGVSEVVMVVPTEARLLREFVGDGGRWGLRASYVVQPEPRGLAHALGCARAAIADDERFLMYLGDDLLDRGVVADFVADFAEGDADASLVVKPVPDPRAFGVVVLEDGRVRRLVEKPQDPPSDLAIVGVYGFGPAIWEALDGLQPSARGELEITDAIDRLVRAGQHVTCHVTEGFWADAGSPTALLAANRYFLDLLERRIDGEVDGGSTIEGEVCIEAGARVRRSRIVGPALIGADCVIEDCRIGPHVALGAECVVAATDVIGSIIDRGCRIERVRSGLHNAIVGLNAYLADLATRDGAGLSLLIADNSVIGPAGGG